MEIDSNCPYLLFGETTSHLTSKLNVMDGRTDGRGVSIFFLILKKTKFNLIFFNIEKIHKIFK